jgi:hypothetical protein
MFPDVDPRKNSITILEAIQSSAQIAKALQVTEPIRASTHRQRAQDLWRFFTDVGLLGDDFLVHDNVTGTADGSFHCCNATVKPYCEARNTITWSYNQGMFLGAMVDLHGLTGDDSYLKMGVKNLDSVATKMTQAIGSAHLVLREPVGLKVQDGKCNSWGRPLLIQGCLYAATPAIHVCRASPDAARPARSRYPASERFVRRCVGESGAASFPDVGRMQPVP